jgi:hypothetical protein
MTRNLKIFALFSFLWSLPFFAFLNWVLENSDRRGPLMLLASLVFGIGFSIAGKRLGHSDHEVVSYPKGLRYGLVAGVIPSVVGGIWVIGWHKDHLSYLVSYIVSIFIGLVIYYAIARRTIKGMPKRKLFQ